MGGIHYMKSGREEKPVRLKVRAYTLANPLSLYWMFVEPDISDVPLIIAGIDLHTAFAEQIAFSLLSG